MPGIEDLPGLISRLEKVAIRLETSTKAQVFSPIDKTDPTLAEVPAAAAVKAYQELIDGPLKVFLEKCGEIGGDVNTIGGMLQKAFDAQKEFLVIVSRSKQPSDADFQTLLKNTASSIEEIQAFREKNRRSDLFNHLSALSESIAALGWVAVAPAPAPFVLEMNNAGQFYTNRVLKDWKEKSKIHVEWVKSWIETLADLQMYVKVYYTTGLVWNTNGGDAMQAAKSSTPTTTTGAPPPPPPPPPPPAPAAATEAAAESTPSGSSRTALLEALNQGDELTKGLRKVDETEMTHKNPSLRAKSAADSAAKKAAEKTTEGSEKPPVMELDGKKWNIEYVNGNPGAVIETTGVNQSVYIYKCNGSTFQIQGKCNNIIMDNCKKTAILFDSVVSSCEFINCQSVKMQVTGSVPTISIDKTDGCQMFLSKESINAYVISAKSSEMNIMMPEGDEFVELPVPEQYMTVINGGKLQTMPTEPANFPQFQ